MGLPGPLLISNSKENKNKIHPEKISYISGKNFPNLKKNNSLLRSFLYFGIWDFLAPNLKRFYISGGNFKVSSLKRFLIFFLRFLKKKL